MMMMIVLYAAVALGQMKMQLLLGPGFITKAKTTKQPNNKA